MTTGYQESFARFSAHQAAAAPAHVSELRRKGIERFAALGFPTTRNEDWHFTSVSPIAEHDFTMLVEASGDVRKTHIEQYLFCPNDWYALVFVNGRFAPELSTIAELPAGVTVMPLAKAYVDAPELVSRIGTQVDAETQAFSALNSAFMLDGSVVHIEKDVELTRPIHLVYVTDPHAAKGMTHPRNLIVSDANSRATVIESYVSVGSATYFTNAVTEVSVAQGATLHHYKIQRESARAFHVGTIQVEQARDSHYFSFSFATGAQLSRTNVYTLLAGEGCGATLNGLYMLDDAQHGDHQTLIVHREPNCYSRELYKGVLDAQSHGVFNGKVYVHPEAQKTDGKQTNKVLLLSERAQIDAKPQLEIFADDVKCTHGATVGQLDQVSLFYMKSRGVGNELARRLLTYAFAADVIETLEQPSVRDELEAITLARFNVAELPAGELAGAETVGA
ncbi:MAG: FeS assembly protein SufD [Gemmatimonadetes bacterium]|nr:FeS assembly protein SufD [Gemmatimonadota bacterium]